MLIKCLWPVLLYLEINRATQIFAAYVAGEFVGVLLDEIKGENRKKQSILQKAYVKLGDFVLKKFFKDSARLYEKTTKEQEIVMAIPKGKVPLKCLIYSKNI